VSGGAALIDRTRVVHLLPHLDFTLGLVPLLPLVEILLPVDKILCHLIPVHFEQFFDLNERKGPS